MIVYIYPIYVDILNQNLTRKESADLLYERKEISNDIEIMGHLCNDPIKVEALKKTPIVQYQLCDWNENIELMKKKQIFHG